jgi:hypothetical protein
MLQDTKLMSGVRVGALLHVIRGVYPHPADLPRLIQVTLAQIEALAATADLAVTCFTPASYRTLIELKPSG